MARIMAAIPAFNEEVAIGSVVISARRHADEVVVIDDGSVDATAEIAASAGARVIRHPKNMGKGAAVRTALDFAIAEGADVLVVHDGDMQHNPGDIPALVRPIMEGAADVVIGSRRFAPPGMPLYRRAGMKALDYATAMASGHGGKVDSQSGFRAFSRRALENLRPNGNGIGVESEMLVQSMERGLRLVEVPISMRYDVDGSTYSPLRHGSQVIGTILNIISEKRPLFFFGLSGLGFLGAAGALAIYTIQLYYSLHIFAIGYAFLFLLFAIVGVLAMFTGIVLNAMRKMAKEYTLSNPPNVMSPSK